MRLHYFFVNQKLESGQDIPLTDEALIHQWRNVFRFKSDQPVVLLDNSGFEWHARLVDYGKSHALVHVDEGKKSVTLPPKEIFLFCSLPKKDKFEWILEKGTELGVSHFVPLISERSEKKDLNIERSSKIIKEAAEQSHHAILPTLHPVMKLEDIFTEYLIPFFAFDPSGVKFDASHIAVPKIGILIGPEGGWTPKELELFQKEKVPLYSLGQGILRTETAAIAVTSLLNL